MKEGAIDRERAVVAHDQAPEVTEPGVGAFDNPSPPVASQRSAVLGRRFLSVAAMRHDQFDTPLPQAFAQRIAVKAATANFSTSYGTAIAANKVSWTTSGVSGGSGSSGTLSSSSWTQVFLSNTNPSSGSITLRFTLAAPGSGTKAGLESLGLSWRFSSVSGGG